MTWRKGHFYSLEKEASELHNEAVELKKIFSSIINKSS